jgi:hypothetical protein
LNKNGLVQLKSIFIMNRSKMLTVDIVTSTQERRKVSFFDDDDIETLRQRIGTVLDIHPARLFIQVALRLPRG